MLVVLKKTYTIRVTIQEGNDEFWESLRGKCGADDVLSEVTIALANHGFAPSECYVHLERFEERGPTRAIGNDRMQLRL